MSIFKDLQLWRKLIQKANNYNKYSVSATKDDMEEEDMH